MISKTLTNTIASALREKPDIIAVYAIGSYARGNVGKDSDFDLAVVVGDIRRCSPDDIYPMLSVIAFPADLDLSVVDRSSSPLFLFQIVSSGIRLYESSDSARTEFEAFVMKNYYDTAHMRSIYYEHLKDKFPLRQYAG